MPERRFSEEEARRVFAAVAERQGNARAPAPGLTLAEMQEAARASGLDPALVAAVVSEMSTGDPGETPTFLGAPLAVRQRRVLPVAVDDDAWARIVALLRQEYGGPGVPTEMGRQREWTSGVASGGTPVHVVLAPGEAGTTVTVEQTVAGQSRGAGWFLPGAVVPTAALAALVHLTGKAGPEIYGLPLLIAAVTGVVLLGLWAMWRGWARRTERQFERVLDRVEILARDAAQASGAQASGAQASGAQASGAAAPPEGAARLDLGALPDPASDDAARTRARERS